jgi:hypothetical protein
VQVCCWPGLQNREQDIFVSVYGVEAVGLLEESIAQNLEKGCRFHRRCQSPVGNHQKNCPRKRTAKFLPSLHADFLQCFCFFCLFSVFFQAVLIFSFSELSKTLPKNQRFCKVENEVIGTGKLMANARQGFTEDDQESLANSALSNKRTTFCRTGLGFRYSVSQTIEYSDLHLEMSLLVSKHQ